jgi:hypothetical protein
MAEKDEEKKPNIVSGILNDLAMGFGLKERDQDYYERTARTIGRNQGSGQAAGRYYDRMAAQGFPAYGGPLAFIGSGAGPRDFFDGGGLGQSGDRFRGSPYSLLANALGIKPMGYYDRDRIGQRGGAGALAALQAGTVPTNTITTPAPAGNGQPETTFEEDFSDVEMYEFEQPMPMDLLTAMATGAINAGVNPAPMLSTPSVYDPTGQFRLRRRPF